MALHFPNSRLLFANRSFALFSDRLENGNFQAHAREDHLLSNYFTETRLIHFKFSLGGRDNEMGFGADHAGILYAENGASILPVLKFGETTHNQVPNPAAHEALEPNIRVTFQLDLREVLASIQHEGGFMTRTGDWVTAPDLEQVYIRGNKHPLNWNFQPEDPDSSFRLRDENRTGIYSVSLVFHQVNLIEGMRAVALPNTAHPFQFSTGLPFPDLLHRLALDELQRNERADLSWNTGAQWEGVWTRDAAYAIILSLGFLDPARSMASLRTRVKSGYILQDTGTGGSWPVSTDRVVWAWAAWETYLASGDTSWLEEAYRVVAHTLKKDIKTLLRPDGLFAGESSFMDWREQSYPAWMEPANILDSAALGTNVLFYQAWNLCALMAKALGRDDDDTENQAAALKENIRRHFFHYPTATWGQFVYPFPGKAISPRPDALALSLAVLTGVLSPEESRLVIHRTPGTDYGIPCFSPFIPDQPAYHNRGIWPFVQAFWNWAGAAHGSEAALVQGLAVNWRSAGLFLTNKENLRADDGMDRPTEVNSDRQLWSVAGMLAMPLRIFLGLRLEPSGIFLQPAVPQVLGKGIRGSFAIRGRMIQYEILGHGRRIISLEMDGAACSLPLPYAGPSESKLTIRLDEEPFGDVLPPSLIRQEGLSTPMAWRDGERLHWHLVPDARTYRIFRDGLPWLELADTAVQVTPEAASHYFQVMALGEWGRDSFLSQPVEWSDGQTTRQIDVPEDHSWLKENNPFPFQMNLDVPFSGKWVLDILYANGAGEVSDGNACAVRSLFLDGKRMGIVAFPHRKANDWEVRGYSTPMLLFLDTGSHAMELRLDSFAENMNQELNRARLFSIRLRPFFG